MSYDILIGKSKEAAVEIHLDGNVPTDIPPHVGLGIGDKKARYTKHLQKCFNDGSKLLNYLAYIHKTAKEKGNITLVCRCKFKAFHALAVKEFLETNKELLDTCLPYLFPKDFPKPEGAENQEVPDDLKAQLSGMEGFGGMSSGNNVQLPPEEMAQIQELIRQDQEREAQAAQAKGEVVYDNIPVIPIAVGDGPSDVTAQDNPSVDEI